MGEAQSVERSLEQIADALWALVDLELKRAVSRGEVARDTDPGNRPYMDEPAQPGEFE